MACWRFRSRDDDLGPWDSRHWEFNTGSTICGITSRGIMDPGITGTFWETFLWNWPCRLLSPRVWQWFDSKLSISSSHPTYTSPVLIVQVQLGGTYFKGYLLKTDPELGGAVWLLICGSCCLVFVKAKYQRAAVLQMTGPDPQQLIETANSMATGPTAFHSFSKLPQELRDEIWRECLPRRVIEIDWPMTTSP